MPPPFRHARHVDGPPQPRVFAHDVNAGDVHGKEAGGPVIDPQRFSQPNLLAQIGAESPRLFHTFNCERMTDAEAHFLSFSSIHPDWTHLCWDESVCLAYIRRLFPSTVCDDLHKPFAFWSISVPWRSI
eukprot:5158023-Pleurochrysis_carterae.AAC.3